MIPLKDENPTRTTPIITILLIGACVVIYFFVQPTGQNTFVGSTTRDQQRDEIVFTLQNAAIPCELFQRRPLAEEEINATFGTRGGDDTACTSDPRTGPGFPAKKVYLALLYSMFLHGSLLHLGGNMLYLWIFGNNIEDRQGRVVYILFYLAAGLVATVAHAAVQPDSTVPVVGASGAIAGVMGAYLVMFPRAQIRSLIIFFVVLFRDIEARWLLGFWFVSQFFINPNEGVAWMAHVGGFVFGVVAGLLWRGRPKPVPAAAPAGYNPNF
ncbi:MAG: rhomboid family intramembrane serine protease [Acidimicrobiales bacterium]